MMKTERENLKRQIVNLIKRSGLPVGTQYLVDHIMLPEHIVLNDLLKELVAERRLSRSYPLLANGKPDCTYNLVS
jgi:hypothetical protein